MKDMKQEYPARPTKSLNPDGSEKIDPNPVAIPVGFRRPETLAEQVRRLVKSERFAQEMEAQGHDTFEEHDDFEVGDDYDPTSPYENEFEPLLKPLNPYNPADDTTVSPQPSADPIPPKTDLKKGSKKTTTIVEED